MLGVDGGVGLVAGALYAVLVMMPLSPVGPIVAGVTYLGVTIWSLVDRSGFERLLPSDLLGEDGVLHRPVGMGTALLAGPLREEQGTLIAELDLAEVSPSRRFMDPTGHYNRPDVFQLLVDTSSKRPTTTTAPPVQT